MESVQAGRPGSRKTRPRCRDDPPGPVESTALSEKADGTAGIAGRGGTGAGRSTPLSERPNGSAARGARLGGLGGAAGAGRSITSSAFGEAAGLLGPVASAGRSTSLSENAAGAGGAIGFAGGNGGRAGPGPENFGFSGGGTGAGRSTSGADASTALPCFGAGAGRSTSPLENTPAAVGRFGAATGGAFFAPLGPATCDGRFTENLGGAVPRGTASPEGITRNEAEHLGHRMLSPLAGTRFSASLKEAAHDGHWTLSIRRG